MWNARLGLFFTTKDRTALTSKDIHPWIVPLSALDQFHAILRRQSDKILRIDGLQQEQSEWALQIKFYSNKDGLFPSNVEYERWISWPSNMHIRYWEWLSFSTCWASYAYSRRYAQTQDIGKSKLTIPTRTEWLAIRIMDCTGFGELFSGEEQAKHDPTSNENTFWSAKWYFALVHSDDIIIILDIMECADSC